jgi:GNAT superfamily N-acetyltransferase
MTIFPLAGNDLHNLGELQPPDWSSILVPLELYLRKPFCHPVKVVENNSIIGIGTAYLHKDTAWLAHIIVHPQARNKGVGLLITNTLVSIAKERGYETIYLIATEMGEPVYRRAGFVTEDEQVFFTREGTVDSQRSGHIVPYEEKYRQHVLALDRAATNEERELSIEDHLDQALLYLNNGEVNGAYLPSWGNGYIVAENEEAGITLMQERIRTENTAVLSATNTAGIDFLLASGFKELKRGKRMRFGRERSWNPSMIYNRVAGKIG